MPYQTVCHFTPKSTRSKLRTDEKHRQGNYIGGRRRFAKMKIPNELIRLHDPDRLHAKSLLQDFTPLTFHDMAENFLYIHGTKRRVQFRDIRTGVEESCQSFCIRSAHVVHPGTLCYPLIGKPHLTFPDQGLT